MNPVNELRWAEAEATYPRRLAETSAFTQRDRSKLHFSKLQRSRSTEQSDFTRIERN
jgi:hypothetical protein